MKTRVAAIISFCAVLTAATVAHAQPQIVLPSPPWRWTDIGAVGLPGDVHLAPNTEWNVSGAGSDIWGTADSFFFVYQPLRDGSISNTFLTETFTDPFAKAGVMIRQTLDPGSPDVILDVKPDGGIEFMTRATQGGGTTFVAGGSVPVNTGVNGSVNVNVTLILSRSGNTVSASYCPGNTCVDLGSVQFPAGDALAGEAVTSHNPSTLNLAFSGSQPTVANVPAPWSSADIGSVGIPGHATYDLATGTFFVSGAGSDIWGSADSFFEVWRSFFGDTVLTARVVSEQDTDTFAKAGLVMGGFPPGASRVILDVKPDGGLEFMARTTDGTPMSFIAGTTASFPVWLRLSARGNEFTGETSADGTTWTTVGAVAMTRPAPLITGFAVTSHDPAALNAARFDSVGVTNAGLAGENLLVNAGFEDSVVPNVGPGWVSDALRGSPAVSETAAAQGGTQNAVCRTTSLDCGIYQEAISSQAATNYGFAVYARADHPGALVGVNVNGTTVTSRPVLVGGYQNYPMGFFVPNAGDVIRVWMYAPAAPGIVDIDDAVLIANPANPQ